MDKGPVCNLCHIRLGTEEKPYNGSGPHFTYHQKCGETLFGEPTNCHVKEVPVPGKRYPRQGYFRFVASTMVH